MSNILLVEPAYRSKFPPLGLMRISTYHKSKADSVDFIRGINQEKKATNWDRIYISSLFTWDLPKTVKTINYYSDSVKSPKNIFVGGPGATLLPDYIKENSVCTVIEGQINKPNSIGEDSSVIAKLTPDYNLLHSVKYDYQPQDAYFTRITEGCVRSCKFCAVPKLEKKFGFVKSLQDQIHEVDREYGDKQNLVVMDNNILGIDTIEEILKEIAIVGFRANTWRNGRLRSVDFNQGLDARLISQNPKLAKLLSAIRLSPVRLAYDYVGMKKPYVHAIHLLAEQGLREFTNYMLFNYNDSPKDLYERIFANSALNAELGIIITGFPMRFIPMNSTSRDFVSKKWKWRYLRGIQCILRATRGLVSPNLSYLKVAFGETYEDFIEIISMPDHYIMYREKYRLNGANDWRQEFRRLSNSDRSVFLDLLADLNKDRNRKSRILRIRKFRSIIQHYYPNGEMPKKEN